MGGGRWRWQCGEEGGGEGVFVQGTVKGGGGRLGEGKSVLFRISFLLLLRFVFFVNFFYLPWW